MNYIFYCLAFLFCSSGIYANTTDPEPGKINWVSWEEAVELNKTNPKKVFIDLYTDWCGWCKKMDKSTFVDTEVVDFMNKHFYAVKFNAEQKEDISYQDKSFKFIKSGRRGVHELAYALLDGRLSYPTFVILDESFARIMISPGFKKAPQIMKELNFAQTEVYKKMSWQDYINQ
jgi:thioredoxin-related protein